MPRGDLVPRPKKKTDFDIVFGSREAEKGWKDLVAARRNACVDAWDFLVASPTKLTPTSYPLEDKLAFVVRDEVSHRRWQLKLDGRNGFRIWYYVTGSTVVLERVFTAHPNETK